MAGEWSVRTLEARAREAGKPAAGAGRSTSAPRLHPDQAESAAVISDALGAVLGTEVRVRAGGTGYRVELRFADAEEALALARRIGPRRVA